MAIYTDQTLHEVAYNMEYGLSFILGWVGAALAKLTGVFMLCGKHMIMG